MSFRVEGSGALSGLVKVVAALGLLLVWLPARAAEVVEADICVYGGTASGVAAGVQAARMGKRAVIVECGNQLGGMTSGGLGATDIGNKAAIGGLAREFYHRVALHYADDKAWRFETREDYFQHRSGRSTLADFKSPGATMWTFEPHVAEEILSAMLKEAKVPVYFQQHLASVKRAGGRIEEIVMKSGRVFRARMFIDATYEGDLMAKAGVSYTVGREANAQYAETINGIRQQTPKHQFQVKVDPYIKPGDPASGLLPFIQNQAFGQAGAGDHAVQAYNFRLCFTRNPTNRLPLLPPPNYDPARYELLARYLEALVAAGHKPQLSEFWNPIAMPNGKTDINNNGGFSTDFIGGSDDYPEADEGRRARIWQAHLDYTRGFVYFLATSPRVPANMRAEMQTWGPARDEFLDTGGWPHQLYVREARRMVSDYVMTEHNCRGQVKAADSIGLAAYGMDSHNCRRLVRDGRVENEGDVQVGGFPPYPISYRSIIPKVGECQNLLVPICLSATHIAYGSIRMEPVFILLGQSAATAAALALDSSCSVQQLDYSKLRARLLADKQILEWRRGNKSSSTNTATTGRGFDRATLLAEAQLPEPAPLPVPGAAIALPEDWERTKAPVSIRLSQRPPGPLSVRRAGSAEGRLYLEIRAAEGPIAGWAEVKREGRQLGRTQARGSVWLSLKPRIGKIAIQVFAPGQSEPIELTAPTTLVEVRGRRIFLNGEPFLLKGATGRIHSQADAAYVHSLGLNTLRGLGALPDAEQYGFMSIASLNFGEAASIKNIQGPDEEFEQNLAKCLEWLKQHAGAPVASPATLILQLGNERTGPSAVPPGVEALTLARRHVSQLLAAARNMAKSLAPMLPVGYANQDLGFLAPDCMDLYMHNSFLDKDRYNYPWDDFMRWQGCLPPEGKNGQGRPFVNSEFGANRYLCQAYLAGPNNPFLERLHAWNFPQRWAEFMEHGTVGGSIYCLCDLDSPRDQGCSRFGILTHDCKPKLACWQVSHMWRDFEVAVRGKDLALTFKRDYRARNCRLTLSPLDGSTVTRQLEDFAPHSARTLALSALLPDGAAKGFRWTLDFTTHAGLVNQAAGAWPLQLEKRDFLDRLKGRDTYPFLSELFDTEVLTADAKPAPRTLAQMTNSQGLIPVALRKHNGVTYLLLIGRENPNQDGALRQGVTIDVAFRGKVAKVNDMTGQPLDEPVEATPIPGGLRLKNIQAARIPGPIGKRSKTPFMLPVYRITP